MSSEMIGEEPAITEDSDLADIIRELYGNKVGRNQRVSDFCVGGALCHYFLYHEDEWRAMMRASFPFPDSLAYDLEWIVRDHASERVQEYYFGDSWIEDYSDVGDVQDREDELEHTLRYYSNAIINANDAGDYADAWVHVDMFLKEFEID